MDRRVRPSPTQTRVGLAILLVLAGIGAALLLQQFRYDPRTFRMDAGTPAARPGAAGEAGDLAAPPGLAATGPTERYDPVTLSDRIDGRAELYLEAGFRSLRCRRFATAPGAVDGVEACLYDMGQAAGAFSVWSRQRREGAPDAGVAAHSYATSSGVFLAAGRYYAEVLATRADPASLEVARRVAASLATLDAGTDAGAPREVALLPAEGRVPGSEALLAANAFGFGALDRVSLARYRRDGQEATAWVSLRKDAGEAAALAGSLRALLAEQGATPLAAPEGVADAWALDAAGMVEEAFAAGRVLAGVHEADSRELADDLLRALYGRVREEAP